MPGLATLEAVRGAFPTSVEELKALADGASATAKADVDAIVEAGRALEGEAAPFSLARRVDLAATEFSARLGVISVVKNVAVDKAVRDAATEALVRLQNESIDLFSSNRDIYRAVKAVKPEPVAPGASLEAQRQYWLADKVAEYERDGHGLPDDKFAEVVALKKELTALSTKFMTLVNEDTTTLVFTPDELAGVPAPILKGLKKASEAPHADKEQAAAKGADALAVGMDYPTYFGVMKNCTVATTRKAVARAFVRRAYPGNEETMAQVVSLRSKLANLLGFGTYADLDLASKIIDC